MNEVVLEWIGYVASGIILVSLLMSSIVKLRWINLVGAVVFAFYGFMVGVLPAALMNVGIVVIDVYYLAKIYFSKEYFTILPVVDGSQYLASFLEFYRDDMAVFNDLEHIDSMTGDVKLYILRNMEIAGVFLAKKVDDKTLEVRLDYAIPRYRDFKLGQYLFETKRDYFLNLGYSTFVAKSQNDAHCKYLRKMGFVADGDTYTKTL